MEMQKTKNMERADIPEDFEYLYWEREGWFFLSKGGKLLLRNEAK